MDKLLAVTSSSCIQWKEGDETECHYCIDQNEDECRRCIGGDICEFECSCEKDMCAKCRIDYDTAKCNSTGFTANNDGFPIKKGQIEKTDTRNENDEEQKKNDENNGGDRTIFPTGQLFGIAISVLRFMI